MQNGLTANRKNGTRTKMAKRTVAVVKGPSLFEVEYLRQVKEELETFLRSKNFGTIQQFEIAFTGADYNGLMKVTA
jgi:hypothetical protein